MEAHSAPELAFSPSGYRISMTRFRGARHGGAQSRHFVLTATNQAGGLTRVRDLHPIPLFSENK